MRKTYCRFVSFYDDVIKTSQGALLFAFACLGVGLATHEPGWYGFSIAFSGLSLLEDWGGN